MFGKHIQNHMIIIFGATGDLMKKKILPALYSLYERGYLSQTMPVICVGRRKFTKNSYLEFLEPEENVPGHSEHLLSGFLQLLNYVKFDIDGGDMTTLCNTVARLDKNNSCKGNKIFYYAISPDLFEPLTMRLKKAPFMKGRGFRRVVFEKPFGDNLKNAKELNKTVNKLFDEKQIFRVDHYLAKELVQNILTFRFSNSIFEQIWNKDFVDSIQLVVSEDIGVEGRADYYDKYGAIKDMLQNHILQMLSLVAMEEPKSLDPDAIRNEKVKVLKAVQIPTAKDLVVGQYGAGKIGDDKVVGYKSEQGVEKKSTTETFIAAKMFVNNKRWKGVPFYVKTGKRLRSRFAEIRLILKDVSCKLFSKGRNGPARNVIVFKIQPEEGISVKVNSKSPGDDLKLDTALLDYCHKCKYSFDSPGAYEMLLRQIMLGDQTLFSRLDEVETSWKIVEPIIATAKRKKVKFPNYKAGSCGPKDSDLLLKRDKREWLRCNK